MIDDVTTEQQEVQRKIGRCLLRLQQYEALLKSIATSQQLSASADMVVEAMAIKTQELSNKTLGQLVGMLTESYLSVDTPQSQGETSHEPASVPKAGWVEVRSRIAMTPERHAQTVNELRQLVALRNEIVHHLIKRFNVWTREGCSAALAYLDESYLTIDRNLMTLQSWATSTAEAHARAAAFFSSDACSDFLEQEFASGDTSGSMAEIISVLREAELAHRQDGWTSLSDAIAFIGARFRERTPKRYGCSSWQQLLHRSDLFEVRRARGTNAKPGATWYRSRERPLE